MLRIYARELGFATVRVYRPRRPGKNRSHQESTVEQRYRGQRAEDLHAGRTLSKKYFGSCFAVIKEHEDSGRPQRDPVGLPARMRPRCSDPLGQQARHLPVARAGSADRSRGGRKGLMLAGERSTPSRWISRPGCCRLQRRPALSRPDAPPGHRKRPVSRSLLASASIDPGLSYGVHCVRVEQVPADRKYQMPPVVADADPQLGTALRLDVFVDRPVGRGMLVVG